MKLLQELLSIVSEEAIETKLAADLWKENKDSVKTYITNVTYSAREVEDSEPKKFEVYKDVDDKRKLVGKFETEDFNAAYAPVRANQKEDAEGYKLYRDAGDMEAFKHTGDTIKVDLEGQTGKLKKGDYLIRKTDGDNFIYSLETAKYFEADYIEKK